MVGFEKRNVNPKNRKTSDCVIRAITAASGKKYETVYKDLIDISFKTGYMIDEKRVYEKLLENYGFVKHKQPRKWDGTKFTIGEIDELIDGVMVDGYDIGSVVISCANHLTAVIDGKVIDLWDCRRKCISNYYTKRKEV